MNMKSSLIVALIASIMFVGVAAAESPDAGDTWSTAKYFPCEGTDTFVSGTLAPNQNPQDGKDCWYSTDYNAGNKLTLYLDSSATNKHIKAEMFDADGDLMQRIHKIQDNPVKYDNAALDYTLDRSPVHVDITGFPGDGAYTFCVHMG
jgi:hypothetical protein